MATNIPSENSDIIKVDIIIFLQMMVKKKDEKKKKKKRFSKFKNTILSLANEGNVFWLN